MKKYLATALFLILTVTAVAENAPMAGDFIMGTISNDDGVMAGVVITERNMNNRIMAQTVTDINGMFVLRVVNPDNRLVIIGQDSLTEMSIDKRYYEIALKKADPLPVTVQDSPTETDDRISALIDLSEFEPLIDEAICGCRIFSYPPEDLPDKDVYQNIYIPFSNIHYGSIQELCDNMYLQ